MTTPSSDKLEPSHGKSELNKPPAEDTARGLRLGKGGGEEISLALDGTTVHRKGDEGRRVQCAVGIEGVGDRGDGDGDGDDTMDSTARSLAFPGFRQDKLASVAVESSGWCSVSPEHGVLLPGEKLEIQLTALVSDGMETKLVDALQRCLVFF